MRSPESLKPKIVPWPTDFSCIIVHAIFVCFYKQEVRDTIHTTSDPRTFFKESALLDT